MYRGKAGRSAVGRSPGVADRSGSRAPEADGEDDHGTEAGPTTARMSRPSRKASRTCDSASMVTVPPRRTCHSASVPVLGRGVGRLHLRRQLHMEDEAHRLGAVGARLLAESGVIDGIGTELVQLGVAEAVEPAGEIDDPVKLVLVDRKLRCRSMRKSRNGWRPPGAVPVSSASTLAASARGGERLAQRHLRSPPSPVGAGGGGGAGAGQLDRRGLEALDGERKPSLHDLAVLDVDDDRLAGPELLPEELLRQRVLDQALDGPAQRPGTERGVVALVDRELLGRLGQLEADALASSWF